MIMIEKACANVANACESQRTIDATEYAVEVYLEQVCGFESVKDCQIYLIPIPSPPHTQSLTSYTSPTWHAFYVMVNGKVAAFTSGPIQQDTGPKTVEELLKEHEIRVETGHDEKESAVRFANAVRVLLGEDRKPCTWPNTIWNKPVKTVDDLPDVPSNLFTKGDVK